MSDASEEIETVINESVNEYIVSTNKMIFKEEDWSSIIKILDIQNHSICFTHMDPSKWEKGLLVLYFKYLLFVCGLTL